MKVNKIQDNNQSFGSIKCSNMAKEYIYKNFSAKKIAKLNKYIEEQNGKVPDIMLNLQRHSGGFGDSYNVFTIVENKQFQSSFSLKNIKNAVKYARKIQKTIGTTIKDVLDKI